MKNQFLYLPIIIIIGLVLLAVVLPSRGERFERPLNQATPSHIRSTVAHREGTDGLIVYFVLVDSSGRETTANGTVTLRIVEENFRGTERVLLTRTREVSASDFRRATVGSGAFERQVILYSFGRIRHSSFTSRPQESSARVNIEFTTTAGRRMEGRDTIFW